MNIIIISQKRDLSSFSPWNSIFFNRSLDGSNRNTQITTIDSWFRNIEYEDIWRGHWGATHIILRSEKIYRPKLKFFSRIKIVSDALHIQRRIVVRIDLVLCLTEVTYPQRASRYESNKRVDVSSALSASNNWICAERHRGHRLIILKEIKKSLT